jgi:superfamily II DNA/RNA helicase
MPDILETTLAALQYNASDLRAVLGTIQAEQGHLNDDDLVLSRMCARLLGAQLARLEGSPVGVSDLLVLTRQLARCFGALRLPQSWWTELDQQAVRFGVRTLEWSDTHVTATAEEWVPKWLAHSWGMDDLRKRRVHAPVLGDGTLAHMMLTSGKALQTYQSDGQRQAAQAAMFAPPGSTTLITLPTGAGKSMCVYLPAWVDSHGGRQTGGTTLVIIPTVALAIDQAESARRFFRSDDPLYKPHYIAGDTSAAERAIIRHGMQAGTIPLLFMSPESLLGSEFHSIVLKQVQTGNIKRIVIDEAHLVETWGASFRTDFQLLSAYFRLLSEASQGQLSVLLLSATISAAAQRTLKQLFTLPGGDFIHVQVNQLRQEIGFWMTLLPHISDNQGYVEEALRHLPRPAIVYFTAPDDANAFFQRLRLEGYERLGVFTGETDPVQRLNLLRSWRENRLDLMIATSAFGLGVDKPDVRTIIHATLPENLDRFYQEVGRAGRDGFSSISLLIARENDLEYVTSTALKARITTEVAWERWVAMFQAAQRVGVNWRVNRQAIRRPDMRASERNKEWNEHVLLLMQRANLLRIVDALSIADNMTPNPDEIVVEITNRDAVNSFDGFSQAFEPVRHQEVMERIVAVRQMTELVKSQTDDGIECIATAFESVYTPVGTACGGCTACRRAQRAPYANPAEIDVAYPLRSKQPQTVTTPLLGLVNPTLQLLAESLEDLLNSVVPVVTALVSFGIQQFVLPDSLLAQEGDALITALRGQAFHPHRLLSDVQMETTGLLAIPTALFLLPSMKSVDRVFRANERWQQRTGGLCIYVIPRHLELPSLNGRFVDRVAGHQETIKHFLEMARQQSYTL